MVDKLKFTSDNMKASESFTERVRSPTAYNRQVKGTYVPLLPLLLQQFSTFFHQK